MEIKRNSLFINQTVKYLLPALNESFTRLFREKIKTLSVLAVGTGDEDIQGIYGNMRTVCFLFDKTVSKTRYEEAAYWFRNSEHYLTDYPYKGIQSNFWMFVFKIPEELHEKYDAFIAGNYSQLYTKEELDTLFADIPDPSLPLAIARKHAKAVMEKLPYAKKQYVLEINSRYNTNITPSDITGEYDFPPEPSDEIFNYKK